MYETILVPTDGSDPANRAIEHALAIADRYGSRIHAMYCVETHRYGETALSSAEIVVNQLEERGQAMLEEFEEQAETAGVELSWHICHGRPWDAIAESAADMDADLIVIGYRGQSHDRPMKMGSVAERVVRESGRPVLTA